MTFFVLLIKELRLRLRRERTIWLIVSYILLMSLLGWFSINNASHSVRYSNSALSSIGLNLYYLLSQIQLFLIIFMTPAFTATSINGEKERQTFDLLLCSRLSAFSLVAGKLIAGLANTLLLIVASAPLFSLVFFFGGITPTQILQALLVYVITAVMLGTVGVFFSALFKRSGISSALTYLFGLCWLALPTIVSFILVSAGKVQLFMLYPNRWRLLFLWNPLDALLSTYNSGQSTRVSYFTGSLIYGLPPSGFLSNSVKLGKWLFSPLSIYVLTCGLMTLLLFLGCLWLVKPRSLAFWQRKRRTKEIEQVRSLPDVISSSGIV